MFSFPKCSQQYNFSSNITHDLSFPEQYPDYFDQTSHEHRDEEITYINTKYTFSQLMITPF